MPHADRDLSTDLQEFQPNGTAGGARQLATSKADAAQRTHQE